MTGSTTRFKGIVSDTDGTLNNSVEEAAPEFYTGKRGFHIYAGLLFTGMHIFKGHSTKKILRCEAESAPEEDRGIRARLNQEGVEVLKDYRSISTVKTRNNFRDLPEIERTLKDNGADVPVRRVGKDEKDDMLYGAEGKTLLVQDNPISTLKDILRHTDSEAVLIPHYYNIALGRLVCMVSKRIHIGDWAEVRRMISDGQDTTNTN